MLACWGSRRGCSKGRAGGALDDESFVGAKGSASIHDLERHALVDGQRERGDASRLVRGADAYMWAKSRVWHGRCSVCSQATRAPAEQRLAVVVGTVSEREGNVIAEAARSQWRAMALLDAGPHARKGARGVRA